MKKFYNTPAVLIKEYEISENFAIMSVGGDDGSVDDGLWDMTGEV